MSYYLKIQPRHVFDVPKYTPGSRAGEGAGAGAETIEILGHISSSTAYK